jgi:hypothetical protein
MLAFIPKWLIMSIIMISMHTGIIINAQTSSLALKIEDFKILYPSTGDSISLMDNRESHAFLNNVKHKGQYRGVIVEYNHNMDNVEMVSQLEIVKPGFETARGIAIGSTKKQVLRTYGPIENDLHLKNPTDLEYIIEVDASTWKQLFVSHFILTFQFSGEKVVRIKLEAYYPF